ncbi:Alpha-ketoglutarate-dependent 2,4-dichlorophenoxyacetate dioxygenase [Pseudocercospora fuligena]|uniref:Alpha-ketoglutarate-dependent 2,4-dichlorophenoxyacetate dioxygenase n=1 Tax=Pseudocercospora fuligena TaxID=685502 RepID=A0A8H6RFL8_9PEZI|nr:Alpha-ketoglutarate-dependent 2,4-dichlorophenoxyacetate dioxygenase [Pseudocercospora fuligena]
MLTRSIGLLLVVTGALAGPLSERATCTDQRKIDACKAEIQTIRSHKASDAALIPLAANATRSFYITPSEANFITTPLINTGVTAETVGAELVLLATLLNADVPQGSDSYIVNKNGTVTSDFIQMRFEHLPEIFDVSNIDPDNNIITEADPVRTSSKRGNTLWHADGAYNPRRSGISIIRAVELPPKGTGGETEYLDSRTAFEDLPQSKKQEIKNYVGMNTLLWNRRQANPEMPEFDLDFTKVAMSKHPISQIHEPTGRGNLYIGSYNHHIEGLPIAEGRRIIDDLMEHVTQEKYKFTVHWEQPGDIAFWDNTAVLHRATVGSYGEKYRRDMRRISTFDNSKWAYGANDPATAKQVGLT